MSDEIEATTSLSKEFSPYYWEEKHSLSLGHSTIYSSADFVVDDGRIGHDGADNYYLQIDGGTVNTSTINVSGNTSRQPLSPVPAERYEEIIENEINRCFQEFSELDCIYGRLGLRSENYTWIKGASGEIATKNIGVQRINAEDSWVNLKTIILRNLESKARVDISEVHSYFSHVLNEHLSEGDSQKYDQLRVEALEKLADSEPWNFVCNAFGESARLSHYNRAAKAWEALRPYANRTPAVAAMFLVLPWKAIKRRDNAQHDYIERAMSGDMRAVREAFVDTGLTGSSLWTYLCKLDAETGGHLAQHFSMGEVKTILKKISKANEIPSKDHIRRLKDKPPWLIRVVARSNPEDEQLEQVIDWFEAEGPSPDKNQRRSWKWIVRKCEEWHQHIAERNLDIGEEEAENLKQIYWHFLVQGYQKGKYRFVALDDALDLKREGEIMNHCVGGRNHIAKCHRGKERVFRVLKRGENEWVPWSTLAIRNLNKENRWKVSQLRGDGPRTKNADPPSEIEEISDTLANIYSHVYRKRRSLGLDGHPRPSESGEEQVSNSSTIHINHDNNDDVMYLNPDENQDDWIVGHEEHQLNV
jgi:hypothetical protein